MSWNTGPTGESVPAEMGSPAPSTPAEWSSGAVTPMMAGEDGMKTRTFDAGAVRRQALFSARRYVCDGTCPVP